MTSSQQFESFVPVYDTVPQNWEEGRQFLVENLKKMSEAINAKEIGFYLDQELLSGKQFIPGRNLSGTSEQFRSVLRKVIDVSPLVAGPNVFPHGITFDANFTLIDSWVSATQSTVPRQAITMVSPEVDMDATNININSPAAFDRAYFFCEYIQEL